MDFFHLFIIFAAGAIAGLMNAIAGGGTIITFPALIFAGLPSIAANATSTVALIPSALGYTFGYRKNIPAVWRWIKLFALVSLVGGFLGGLLLVRTPPAVFDWLVPFLILTATVLFMAQGYFKKLFRIERRPDGLHRTRWIVGAVFFQFVVSVYGGYFGAGIGILMLATLGMLGVGDIHEMNTVKGILGFLINIVAAVYFAIKGLVHWEAALVMICGSVIGGYSGAHFAQRIPEKAVRRLITGIGLVLTLYTLVKQIKGKL
jgi:hypothetical protein